MSVPPSIFYPRVFKAAHSSERVTHILHSAYFVFLLYHSHLSSRRRSPDCWRHCLISLSLLTICCHYDQRRSKKGFALSRYLFFAVIHSFRRHHNAARCTCICCCSMLHTLTTLCSTQIASYFRCSSSPRDSPPLQRRYVLRKVTKIEHF